MNITPTHLPEVLLLTPRVFGDERGFFMETWRDADFRKNVADVHFVQDNHSQSADNVLRGLHYQIQRPQGKLVRVIAGEAFDVAVDLRRHSPRFGQWTGARLSAANKQLFWIPPGFAHGFYVLSRTVELIYKCTDYYFPEYDRALRWNDPAMGIDWPLTDPDGPVLSHKDQTASLLKDAEVYP